MSIDKIQAEIDRDLDSDISRLAKYADQIVQEARSTSHLAQRLNGDLALRFVDLHRSFVANLESRLGDLGEEFVGEMDAKTRIKYYDTEIEKEMTKDISLPPWVAWQPDLVPRVKSVAGGCAVIAGIGTGLSLAKACGILPIKLPLLLGSPTATVLFYLMLTSVASATAIRPDALQCVLEHERKQAQNHLAAHLATLRQELAQSARRAAEGALAELEILKTSHDSSSPSR